LPFAAKAEDTGSARSDSMLSMSGVVDFSVGEVMKGMYRAMMAGSDQAINFPAEAGHNWFGQPLARLNLDARPSERLQVRIGVEANIFINTFPPEYRTFISSNGGQAILPTFMDVRLHQAQGIFSLCNSEVMSLNVSLGLMPYKYNPEIRNLGEFLFRSGTYPFFLVNSFNFPLARLSGLRLNFSCGTEKIKFTFDQFALIERDMPPLDDISFASVAGVNVLKILDIGAGVDFARAISVNSKLTTPDLAQYEIRPGDTGRYTFQGTKLMARATIDPLGMMRGDQESIVSQIAGENGGKIYGEIAIIGLKNYPASQVSMGNSDPLGLGRDLDVLNPWGYTTISERMPWVVGINIPMWKLLDVCAFELEKYPAPYPNDYYETAMHKGLPVPAWSHFYRGNTLLDGVTTWNNPYDSATYSIKRWYWSLYMKKQVVKCISLFGQVSRDHMRWDINLGNKLNNDTEEIMVKPGQWAWRFGLSLEY
jgi:hypothetical protein